ncbi:MAG: hypothetical protein PHD97_07025 [Bacteroidales bacterium]|nr:hypothetical protein [Bacteroidales bacterium]
MRLNIIIFALMYVISVEAQQASMQVAAKGPNDGEWLISKQQPKSKYDITKVFVYTLNNQFMVQYVSNDNKTYNCNGNTDYSKAETVDAAKYFAQKGVKSNGSINGEVRLSSIDFTCFGGATKIIIGFYDVKKMFLIMDGEFYYFTK